MTVQKSRCLFTALRCFLALFHLLLHSINKSPLQKGLRIVHLYWPVFVTSPDLFKKYLLLQI